MKVLHLISVVLPFASSIAASYIHDPSARHIGKRWTSTNPQVTVEGSVCTIKVRCFFNFSPDTDGYQPLGGGRDDGPAILYAFNELCSSNALINLPGYYTVHTVLQTSLTNVEVRLTGAINYVPDIAYWSPASIYLTYVRHDVSFANLLRPRADDGDLGSKMQRLTGSSPETL